LIAIDTNLLVYAHKVGTPFHLAAQEALRPVVEGSSPWAVPWQCIHEFLGVVTNSKIYKPASTLPEALGYLDGLLTSPNVLLLSEGSGYFQTLRQIVIQAKVFGPRIHDAHIAALCLHHGVRELWTADRDFTLFPQLKTRNPLKN
jgi:toxin-antitoxin system PIN domain toxin